MRNCGAATETTIHYLLRCRLYSVQRAALFDGVDKLDSNLQNSSEDQLLTVSSYMIDYDKNNEFSYLQY